MAEVHGAYLVTPPSLSNQDFTTVPLAADASLTVHVNNFPAVGDATATKQDTGNTSLASIDSKTPALVSGRQPVDGSGVTQPISGSISVSNFPGTQPISGTVTANIGTSGSLALDASVTAIGAKLGSLGQKTSANSAPVVLASDQSTFNIKSVTAITPTASSVSASTSLVTLLSSNADRLGATFQNDSTDILLLKLGNNASTTSYTVRMVSNSYYEIPFQYTGIVTGVWTGTNGAVRVCELS